MNEAPSITRMPFNKSYISRSRRSVANIAIEEGSSNAWPASSERLFHERLLVLLVIPMEAAGG